MTIRSLLEHVGIDTTGRDIHVGDRLVDPAPLTAIGDPVKNQPSIPGLDSAIRHKAFQPPTLGMFAHGLVQAFDQTLTNTGVVLIKSNELGLVVPPKGTCVCCGKPHGRGKGKCDEWGVRDDNLGRRGHMDGLLDIPGWCKPGDAIFDLKTCAPPVIRGIESHDLDAFKLKWPKYYAQAQEYMALTGKLKALILFLSMSEGWQMREFTIPRDDLYIARLEAKYRIVRRHVEMGTPPPVACCSTRAAARKCPATACTVKIGIAA